MKKFFLMLQLAALSAGSSAFALTGGPFENSDHGILLERGGFYQNTFTCRNGNGYSIWTPDAQWYNQTGDFRRTTLNTPATNRTFSDHNGNRSVFYYKGVMYVGGAFGSVDLDAREIEGYANLDSEVTFSSTTSTQGTGTSGLFIFPQNSTSSTTSTVVINNRAYFANLSWTGKIYQRSPILRYRGSGEVVILSPSGTESLAGLAYTAYSGLIGAIISATAQSGNSIIGVDPGLFADAQLAIENALVGLEPRLTGTGPSNGYNESEKRKVRVKGMRRFF